MLCILWARAHTHAHTQSEILTQAAVSLAILCSKNAGKGLAFQSFQFGLDVSVLVHVLNAEHMLDVRARDNAKRVRVEARRYACIKHAGPPADVGPDAI